MATKYVGSSNGMDEGVFNTFRLPLLMLSCYYLVFPTWGCSSSRTHGSDLHNFAYMEMARCCKYKETSLGSLCCISQCFIVIGRPQENANL